MDQRPNNYNDQGSNGQEPNGNGGPGGPKNKSSLLVLLICVLATLLIWTVFSNILQSSTSKEITYDKFLEMLDKRRSQVGRTAKRCTDDRSERTESGRCGI